MIIADIHTHTKYSHAANSVEEMAAAARGAGLKIYGFSEHSPRPQGYVYPRDYQEKLLASYPRYISEVQELCRESRPDFTVLCGLELDFMTAEVEFARASAKEYDFDYIIGGLHFQDAWGFDGSQADWEKLDREAGFRAYTRYYEDMRALCESGLADIIAHPDLIKLFSVETFRDWLATAEARESLRQTFGRMRELDVIMEVSSAGLRKPCREIYPGPQIMELAASLGLKICISSDAHSCGQIADSFSELEAYVRGFGYRESWIVQKRRKKRLPFA